MDGGPYIKSPSNGKFIEVDAERGDYVLTTDVMGYVANTYDMYIGANIEETDITKIKEGQSVKVRLTHTVHKNLGAIVTQVNSITIMHLRDRQQVSQLPVHTQKQLAYIRLR